MIGGNDSERKKSITIRGGFFNIFSRNNYDLDPNFAIISEIPDSDGKIDPKTGKVSIMGYSQSIKYLAGIITDIQLQRRTRKIGSKMMTSDYIDIHLDSGGTPIIIELNFDSGPGKSFAAAFRNVIPYIGNMLCIKAYQLKPEDGQEHGRQGVLVYANTIKPLEGKGVHIPPFYVSAKSEMDPNLIEGTHYFRIPSFEKRGRTGAMEYDKDAALDWLYTAFREDVYYVFNHYELAEEVPQQFGQSHTSPPPPTANNFYANAPQENQPVYNQQGPPPRHPAPQQYANTGHTPAPPAPPSPQQNFGPPPQPNNTPQRPQRTDVVPPPPPPQYAHNQPIHEVVAPPTPPPPTRDYVQREPMPVDTPQNNVAYNPNAGMSTARTSPPPPADDFSPFGENDDLPF